MHPSIKSYSDFLFESNPQDLTKGSEILSGPFWDKDDSGSIFLKKKIQDKILDFVEDLRNHLPDELAIKEIKDIHFTGSHPSYENGDKPEADIILIIDLSSFDSEEKDDLKDKIEKSRVKWNIKNKPKIDDFYLDFDIHDDVDPHSDSALYSIKNNTWLKSPDPENICIDERDVVKKYLRLESEIDYITARLKDDVVTSDSKSLLASHLRHILDRLITMKCDSPGRKDFPHIGNLCYRKLKKEGYIKKIVGTLVDNSKYIIE